MYSPFLGAIQAATEMRLLVEISEEKSTSKGPNAGNPETNRRQVVDAQSAYRVMARDM